MFPLSVAWGTVRDVHEDEDVTTSADEPPLVPSEHLLAGRGSLENMVAAVLTELLPYSRRLSVTIADPENSELARVQEWVTSNKITEAQVGEWAGTPVAGPDVLGWISHWPVSAQGRTGTAARFFQPGGDAAELAVDLADWLHTVLADNGVSGPVPPCPGHPHPHPMRPVVHEAAPWWQCPQGGLVRPWLALPAR